MPSKQIQLKIRKVQNDQAIAEVVELNPISCDGCSQRNSCQKLSISHFIKKDKLIKISNQAYQEGELVNASLSDRIIQNSFLLTLLLPLIGFILTILLLSKLTNEIIVFITALVSLYLCQKLGHFIIDKRLVKKIQINK